jgi:hypothetical protein
MKKVVKVPIGYDPILASRSECPQISIDYRDRMPEGYEIEIVRKAIKEQVECPRSWLQYYQEMPRGYNDNSAARGKCPESWIICYDGSPVEDLEGNYDLLEYEYEIPESLNTDTYGVTEDELDDPNFWINL